MGNQQSGEEHDGDLSNILNDTSDLQDSEEI